MAKYNVAITGLNAGDIPCPGISVIRSLKEGTLEDVKVIGLAYELLCSASYMDSIVDEVYHVPFPHEDEGKYLSRMREITEKTKIDVLIPTLDFEIPVMSKLEPELKDLGISLLVPSIPALELCRKENLSELAELTDVDAPEGDILDDRREIVRTAANFTYPLVLKAATGEAQVVYSLEEAIVFGKRLSSVWGWPLIMQEHIKGDEYAVASLADRTRRVIGSVCMKKVLTSRNGNTWMGVTTKDDALIKLAKKIIKELKWIGPMEIEFIKEYSSGKYFLIEINPRFPSWIQFTAKVGCNLPLAYVKIMTRERVEPFPEYRSGVLFARSKMDITCGVSRLGELATKKELIYHEK